MSKVIEFSKVRNNNAALMLGGYTKEELELIEGYKALEEFYKEANKEEWYIENGQLKVRYNN